MTGFLRVCLCVVLGGAVVHAPARAQTPDAAGARPRNEKAFQSAVKRLQSKDAVQRAAAADEMGRRGHRYRREIGDLLRPVLRKDPVDVVRAAAGRALGRLGVTDAVPELVAALSDDSSDVRVVAAAALWRLPDPSAVPALLGCTRDSDAAVREWCALALGVVGDESAVPAMVNLLVDPVAAVRLSAIRSLGRIGAAGGVQPLRQHFATRRQKLSAAEIEEVVNAIAAIRGVEAVEALLAMLAEDPSPRSRLLLAAALGQLGDDRALPHLRVLSRSKQLSSAQRTAVLQAIRQLTESPVSARQPHDAGADAGG